VYTLLIFLPSPSPFANSSCRVSPALLLRFVGFRCRDAVNAAGDVPCVEVCGRPRADADAMALSVPASTLHAAVTAKQRCVCRDAALLVIVSVPWWRCV
jgi:hypothetical protein